MRQLPVVAALLIPLLAGCISLPETPDGTAPGATAPPAEERVDGMAAEESAVDTIEPCDDDGGIQIPPGRACAHRILTATGRIGVDALPVDLSTVNGAISLTSGSGDAWSFIADIRVRALTEDAARKGLDTTWAWSHEDGGQHHLRAAPTPASPSVDALGATLEGASYQIVLPSWVVLDVRADATNGAMVVQGFRLDGLDLKTTNGAFLIEAEAPSATLSTTNGAIQALLAPSASGAYKMTTTNGQIALMVPEDRAHGYDIEAQTTNGNVEITLEGGSTSEENMPASSRATYVSDGYEGRSIQTTVDLETTNGSIVVGAQ